MKWFKLLTALPSDPQLKRTFRHIDARGAAFDGISPVALEKQRTFGAFTLLCCYVGNHGSSRHPGLGVQADGSPLPLADMAAECCFFTDAGDEHVEALTRWLDRCAEDGLIDADAWRTSRVVSIPYMQGNADEYTQRAVVVRSPDKPRHLPTSPDTIGTSPDMSKNVVLDKKRRDQIRKDQDLDLSPDQDRGGVLRRAASASTPPPSPTLLTFPTTGAGAKTWAFTEAERDALSADYPGVDIVAHVRRAHSWIRANPGRRKTAAGMRRFLVNWLNRDVARGTVAASVVARSHPGPVRRGGVPAAPDKYAALQAAARAEQERAAGEEA